jgi:hypothetical protein
MEARTLLVLNQRRRARAESVILLAAALTAVAAVIALATEREQVLLPVPATVLALLALAFQIYADVTVIGAARERLEADLRQRLGAEALLYESHVADVRKNFPLVRSVRVTQAAGWAAAFAVAIAGAVISAEQAAWAAAVYGCSVMVACALCVLSFRAMRRSGDVAREAFSGVLEN